MQATRHRFATCSTRFVIVAVSSAMLPIVQHLNSQSAMRNFIHKERTIELAFEEHRWWDVRRWNVAGDALGRDIYGVNVAADGTITRKVAQ